MKTYPYIVYMFTNKKTNRSYIGKTHKTLQQRFSKHIVEARFHLHKKSKFHHTIRKFNYDRLVWQANILYVCVDNHEAVRAEVELIETYNTFKNGYNTTPGGDCGPVLYGRDNGMYGKTHTKEVREKLARLARERFAGKTYEEMYGKEKAQLLKQRRQRQTPLSNYRKSGAENNNAKTYQLTDPQGNIYTITGHLREFCKEHSVWVGGIIDVAKGRKRAHKGWTVRML